MKRYDFYPLADRGMVETDEGMFCIYSEAQTRINKLEEQNNMVNYKFKGKKIKNGEWAYGYLTSSSGKYGTIKTEYSKYEMEYRIYINTLEAWDGKNKEK